MPASLDIIEVADEPDDFLLTEFHFQNIAEDSFFIISLIRIRNPYMQSRKTPRVSIVRMESFYGVMTSEFKLDQGLEIWIHLMLSDVTRVLVLHFK